MGLFDDDILDEDGEPHLYLKKTEPEFFERITSLMPMHIAFLPEEQLVRVLEILVKKGLGSDRLFLHYLYVRIERRVLMFSTG
jgi:hypothetical protein